MKTLAAVLVCAFSIVPAWGQGPSFDVPVDLDLIGAYYQGCDPWPGTSYPCIRILWGGTANRLPATTRMRVPQFWDESAVTLRFFFEAGSTSGGSPGPGNEFRIRFIIQGELGSVDRDILVPYPTPNETVEVELVLDDLPTNGVNPGGGYQVEFIPMGHSDFPGALTYYGAATLYFHVVIPFIEGDCNWDGVVDASDMSCLVNAAFN